MIANLVMLNVLLIVLLLIKQILLHIVEQGQVIF